MIGLRPSFILGLLIILPVLGACQNDRFAAEGWSGMVLVDNTLYVGTRSGSLFSINPENGSLNFPALEFPEPFGKDDKFGGIYGQPQYFKDTVYLNTYESRKDYCEGNNEKGKTPCGRLYSLPKTDPGDPTTRLRAWSFPRFGQPGIGTLVGSPFPTETAILIGSSDGFLYAVNPDNGLLLWKFQTGGQIWSSPIVEDNVVFVGSLDHTLYAIDIHNGRELWHFTTGGGISGRPLVKKDKVYVGSFDRTLYAIATKTGNLQWKFKGDQWFWAGPVADDKALYAVTLGGTLYALNMETGQSIWLDPPIAQGSVVVPPLLLENYVLYVTDAGVLSLVEKSNGLETWGPDVGAEVRSPLITKGDFVYISDLNNTIQAINIKLKDLPGEGSDSPGVWKFQLEN